MKKKIKIIDILCYISIGDFDKLPKKIEYQGIEYIFDEDDYKTYKGANLLDDACLTRYITSSMLNDFAEVLDVEDEFEDIESFGIHYSWDYINYKNIEVLKEYVNKDFQNIFDTLDKLIKNQKKIISKLGGKND